MSSTESDTVEIPRTQFERLLDRVGDLEPELAEYRTANERDKASIRQQLAGDDYSAAVDDAEADR